MRGPPNGQDEQKVEPVPAVESGGPKSCHRGTQLFVNRTGDCAYRCDAPVFSKDQKSLASALLNGVGVAVCLLAVVCSILSCCRSSHLQYRYPEVIFVLLTICFAVVAGTELLVQWNGSSMYCVYYGERSVLVSPGLPHVSCATVAVLIYYASTAARCWWAILCWTWYLASPRRLPPATIHQRLNFRLQVIAWGGPMVCVMVALMTQAVDADPLTGVCMIGYQSATNAKSTANLLLFVIVRELVTLAAGLLPLLLSLPLLRREGVVSEATATPSAAEQLNRPAAPLPPPSGTYSGSLCALTAACYLPVSVVLLCCYVYQYAMGEQSSEGSRFETALLRAVFELVYGVVTAVAWMAWALVPCRLFSRPIMMPYLPKAGSLNTYVSAQQAHTPFQSA